MRLLLLLVGGLSLLFAGLLTVQLLQPWSSDPELADATGVVPASRLRVPVATPAVAAAPVQHGDDWVATILGRPLFTRDRRPATAATAVASAAAASGLPRLTAITVSPDHRRAIFAGADGAKPIVVEEGGSIAGFVVQTIGHDGVTVQGPDGQRTVALAFDPTPAVHADADQPPQITPPLPYGMPYPYPQPGPGPGLGLQPGQGIPPGIGLQPGPGLPNQGYGLGRAGPGFDPNAQPHPGFNRPRAELGGAGPPPLFRSS